MMVRNDSLPAHLQGKNSDGYVHNTTAYATKNFRMSLRTGEKMDCRVWAEKVEQWIKFKEADKKMQEYTTNQTIDKLCIHSVGDRLPQSFYEEMFKDAFYPTGASHAKPSKRIVPVNTTFFDCGDVCIVTWSDGTATKVRFQNGEDEQYNGTLAITIAFIKKFHGLDMYDMLLDSVDKIERDEMNARVKKLEEQIAAEEARVKKYNKAVKKAAKRAAKKARFEADVKAEMNNQYA